MFGIGSGARIVEFSSVQSVMKWERKPDRRVERERLTVLAVAERKFKHYVHVNYQQNMSRIVGGHTPCCRSRASPKFCGSRASSHRASSQADRISDGEKKRREVRSREMGTRNDTERNGSPAISTDGPTWLPG